jgi:hypothetical protein
MRTEKEKFRSTFPELPSYFVLAFRIFDVTMSFFFLVLLIHTLIGGVYAIRQLDFPFFFLAAVFLSLTAYCAVSIYGLMLDFLSGSNIRISVFNRKIVVKSREGEKTIGASEITSIDVIRVRLLSFFTNYVVVHCKSFSEVVEISDRDWDSIGRTLGDSGFAPAKRFTVPFLLNRKGFSI